VALLNRTTLEINVLHDRNPPFVRLSDGGVRNGYTIKILNKLHQPREFTLATEGLPGAQLAIVGLEAGSPIRVRTDDLRELKVFVTLAPGAIPRGDTGSVPFSLVVRDAASGTTTARSTNFQTPSPSARHP
jgi:polyferredoxin